VDRVKTALGSVSKSYLTWFTQNVVDDRTCNKLKEARRNIMVYSNTAMFSKKRCVNLTNSLVYKKIY